MADDEHEWMIITQRTLDGLIQRPKVTHKLLSRPPFRFLHDVLIEIMRVTGYGLSTCPVELTDVDRTFVRHHNFPNLNH